MEVLFPKTSSSEPAEAAEGHIIADIVAVHGLASDPNTTWSPRRSGARSSLDSSLAGDTLDSTPMWLRDFLPKENLNARIMAFNHNTAWSSNALSKSLDDHGADLLRALRRVRNTPEEASRPIIFIGHSFGGLIIKQALVLAQREFTDRFHNQLCEKTRGFIFMGTPHKGAQLTKLGILISYFGYWRGSSTSLLNVIEQNSNENCRLHESFLTFLRQSCGYENVVCIFETITEKLCGFSLNPVVEKASAILEVCPIPQQIGFEKSHRELHRFPSPDDGGYNDTVFWIRRLLRSQVSEFQQERTESQTESLQSLAFPEMNRRNNDITLEADGTCRWVLTHERYLAWLGQKTGLLWIKGNPGAGKSTLLKFALRRYQEQQEALPNEVSVAAFFCHGRGAPIEKSPLGLFSSLLHQILDQDHKLLIKFALLHKNECQKRGKYGIDWKWHVAELQEFFLNAVLLASLSRPTRLYIDALDECGEEAAQELVQYLNRLIYRSSDNQLSICFSCRHHPLLGFNHGLTVSIDEENRNDIGRYVAGYIKDAYDGSSDMAQELEEEIVKKSSGNFQWVVLVTSKIVRLLNYGEPPKALMDVLRALPSELHELYQNLLDGTLERDRPNSLLLMQWVCFATEPLLLAELRFAMVFDADGACQYRARSAITGIPWRFTSLVEMLSSTEYVDADEGMKKRLLRLSAGLVEVREGRVQFIHQSVRDHLVPGGLQTLSNHSMSNIVGESQFRLSRICIRYAFMKEIQEAVASSEDSMKRYDLYGTLKSKSSFPFLEYAALNWIHHAQTVEMEEIPQQDLLGVLQWPSTKLTRVWGRYLLGQTPSYNTRTYVDRGITLLHISSAQNLSSVVESILDDTQNSPDAKDRDGRTPLSYAAMKGHEKIVKLLVDRGAQVDAKDDEGRTPLSWAAQYVNELTIKLLADREDVDADSRDNSGRTPLSWTAEYGDEFTTKLLADREDVDADSRDNSGTTPLSWTAEYGDEFLTKVLVDREDVDADSRDNSGRTPLSWSAERGDDSSTKLLVDREDVDADSRDNSGRTPLSWAAEYGDEFITKLLADREDVDADSRDNSGRTPLSWSAERGDDSSTKLLVDREDVDVSSKDNRGRTPLFWAVFCGSLRNAALLLRRDDVDVDAEDSSGKTPLFYAGFEEMARLLLGGKAEVDHRDNKDRTPLWIAAARGHVETVGVLMEQSDVDINAKDYHGNTPWVAAAGSGDKASTIQELLEDRGAYRMTPIEVEGGILSDSEEEEE